MNYDELRRDALPTAFLSLGSNLGDRLENLKRAVEKIEGSDEIAVKKISPVYETQPVGYEGQGWFLNLVVQVQTSLESFPLLERLLSIEDEMGRTRGKKSGPRNIDVDILLYDNQMVDSERLTIPHPRMHERRFVLVPLAQIAPKLLHPRLKKNIEELLVCCRDGSGVRPYPEKV
ncbi:MAG: 2-amino-4-hydroxy-6-hydroxymethyldihydropteridine diphosphokinase [Candidatus Zixiibacteriota bacterium]